MILRAPFFLAFFALLASSPLAKAAGAAAVAVSASMAAASPPSGGDHEPEPGAALPRGPREAAQRGL
jgi:hypothetical protein